MCFFVDSFYIFSYLLEKSPLDCYHCYFVYTQRLFNPDPLSDGLFFDPNPCVKDDYHRRETLVHCLRSVRLLQIPWKRNERVGDQTAGECWRAKAQFIGELYHPIKNRFFLSESNIRATISCITIFGKRSRFPCNNDCLPYFIGSLCIGCFSIGKIMYQCHINEISFSSCRGFSPFQIRKLISS
ncbi:unnamed protein product [Albugo candida]|uniref:Uncharacterized protein n=1 Tax=Albugo candida TaxID=65357 RepID=A0A024FWS5_9STRA|nr:unnamed protein product [Albugo candida]|eukprot:CCI11104.1 unnamed protein product [Albugo candida]